MTGFMLPARPLKILEKQVKKIFYMVDEAL